MHLNDLLSQPEFRLSVHAICAGVTGSWALYTKRKVAPYLLGCVAPAMVAVAAEVPAMQRYALSNGSSNAHLAEFLAVGYAPIFPALYLKSRREDRDEKRKKTS